MTGTTATRRRLAALPLALALGFTAVTTACSSDSDSSSGDTTAVADGAPAPGVPSAEVALEEERTVIDVRTPEEYEAGHVEGAELINIQGPDFDAQVAELDPATLYVVYCRSGNRSAAAAAAMAELDLDVLDGGALDDMAEAGWPTVG